MARYRIPGKNYSRRSIFGITAIVVVVAAIVAAGVAVAVLPTMVDGLEGSEFVTDGGYTRPVVTAIVLENDGQISVNANLESVFATVQYSDGSTEQVALSEMVIEGLDLTAENVSSGVVLNFGGFEQRVDFKVIPTTLTVTYIAGEGGSIDGDLVQQVIAGQDATTVRAVPNAGYEFVRWTDGYPEEERRDRNISKTTTLQAVFTRQTFTVVFFYPDGTTAREEKVQYGMNATDIPDPDEGEMRMYGYRFAGWDASYEHITQNMEIHPIMVKHAIDLNFTATQDANGNLGGISDIQPYYPIGEQSVLRLSPNTEREFLAWNITDMNGNVVTIPKSVIAGEGYNVSVSLYDSISVTFTAGQTGTEGRNEYTLSFTIPETAVAGSFEIDIHADFAYSTSVIAFTSAGATGNIYTAELDYGTSVGTLFDAAEDKLPVRNGYTFVGWYHPLTAEILDGDEYITMDTTLTAYWTTKFYEVTFILDDVIENISDFSDLDGYFEDGNDRGIKLLVAYSDTLESAVVQTVDGVEYGVYPEIIPERTGYVFEGWYLLDVNGALTGSSADRNYRVGGETAVRARFTPRTISLTPVANGGAIYTADNVPILGTTAIPVTEDFAFRAKPALGYVLGDITLQYDGGTVTLYKDPGVGEDGYFNGVISSLEYLMQTESVVLTVEFVSLNHSVGITVSGGNGEIAYSQTGAAAGSSGTVSVNTDTPASISVPSGSSVTLNIAPASLQQRISAVAVDNVNVLRAPQSEYTLILENVTADKNVEISFENVYYSIQFPDTSSGAGADAGFTIDAGDVTPVTQHLQGSDVTFTVTAKPGKYLSAIRVNGTFMDVYNRDASGITAYCRIDEYEVNYKPIADEMPGNAPAGTAAARATENDYRITKITFTVAGIMQNTVISVAAEDIYYYVNTSVTDGDGNAVAATLNPGSSFTVGYRETAVVSATVANTYYISEVLVNGERVLAPTVTTSALSYTTDAITNDIEITYVLEAALHTITFMIPEGVGIDYNGSAVAIDPNANAVTFGNILKGSSVQFRVYTVDPAYQLTAISRSISYAGGQGAPVNEVIGFRVSSHNMTFNAVDNDYEVEVETALIDYTVDIFAVNHNNMIVSIPTGDSVIGNENGGMLTLDYAAVLGGGVEIGIQLLSDYALETSDVTVMNASGGDYTYSVGSGSTSGEGYYYLSGTGNDKILYVGNIGSDISIYLNVRNTAKTGTLTFGVSGDGELTAQNAVGEITSGYEVTPGETIKFTADPTGFQEGARADLLGFLVNGVWTETPSSESYVYEYTATEGDNQVFAVFGEVRWAVIIESGIIGGDVMTDEEWVSGKNPLTVRLIPDEGYMLVGYSLYIGSENVANNWGGIPSVQGEALEVTFDPSAEYNGVVTVTATFEQIEYTVTVANDDANGTVVSATGDYASVPYGSEVRLNIGANTGYFISSVVVNGLEYGAVNLTNAQYNDDMRQYTSGTLILTVTIDTVVEISYMPGEYTLTIVDNPGGTTYAAAGPADSASPYADVDSLSFSGTDVINLRLEAESGYHIESVMINGEIYDEWLASAAGIEDEVRQLLLTLAAGDDLRGQGNVDIDVRYAINTYELSLTAVNTSPNFAVYDDDPVDFGTVTVFGETPDASGKYADVDHGSNVLIVFAPVLSKHYYIYSITVNGTRLGADAVPATGGNYLINVTDDVSVTVEYKREAYSYSLLTSFSDDMDEIVQSEGNSWNGVLSMAFRNPYDSSIEVKSENGTYEYGLRYVLTANAGTGYFVESLTVNGEERSQYLGSGSTLMGTLSSNLDIESVFMIKFHTVKYSAEGTDHGTVGLNIVGRDGITVVDLFSSSVAAGAVLPLSDGGIVRITGKDEAERKITLEVSYGSLLEFVGSPNFTEYGEAVAGISLRSGNNAINVTLPTEGEAMNLERTVVDDTVLRVTFATVRYDFIVTSSTGGRIELSNTVDDDNTVAWKGTVSITLTLDEGYELAAGAVAVSVNGTFDQSVSNDILSGLITGSGRYSISEIRSDYVITITPTRKHIDGAFTGNYKISHGSNVADSRLQIAKEGGATFGTRFDGTLNNDGAFIATDQSGRYIGILYNDSVNISLTPIEGYVLSTVTVTMTMEGGETVTYGIGDFSNISGTAGKTLNIPAVKGDLTIYVEYAKNEYSLNITVRGTAYGGFSGGTITGESGDSVAISGTSGLTVQHYDGLSLMFSARFGYYASSFEICGRTMDIGEGSDYVVNVEKNGSSCYVYTATFDVTALMLNNRSALDVSVTFSAQQYDLRIGYRGTAGEYVTASTEYGRLSYTSGGTGTLLNYSVAAGYEIVNAEIFNTAAWSSSSARAIGILTRIDALTENRSPETNEYLSRPRVGAQTYQLSMRIDIGKALKDANLPDNDAASIIEAMNIHSGNRTVYLIFSAALSVYDMGFDGAYVVWPDSYGRAAANAFATTASGNLMIGNTPYLSYTTRFEYQSGSDGTNLNDHRHGTVAEMTVVVNESGSRSFRFEGIQEFVNGAWVYRANGEAGMTIDDAGSTITVSYTMESTRTFRIIFYEIFEVALEMTPLYKYMGGSFASGLPGSLIYNTYANISAAANYEGIETDDGADYNDIYPNVPGNYEVLNGVEERAGRMLYSVRCGATILPAAVDNTNSSTVQKADISFYYAQAAGDETILENALPDGGTTVTSSETYYGADKAMRLLLSISFATEGEAINTAGGNIVGADVADGSITVNPGSTLNLTVQPDAGYRLGAVGYLPDTGTPGVYGRRVFLNDYVMYDVVAGSSIDNAELPFKLTPAGGNNYTMSFDKISEGMVIRIVFIKQVSVTREIQLLDGYVPPTFYSVFGWTNSTGVTEWTVNADGSQTAVVDYGTAMGMQISDAITASNTGNNVRYRFVGYLINGVMQDNSLSRAYPSSTVGNFVISDTTMNGAEIEGMSGNFTVDIVALYQPIYTIIIDNLYYDSESGTYMDPGSIAVRTYPYNSTRIQYYQSYDEIPAYVSGGSGGNGKYIFRVSGGINGSTGTSYNQWSDNTITLSWLQGGSSAGFGLFSWEVYAYNRDTASWEWKALSANNNYTFNVNSLYNDSYYMYLNAQNAIEGDVPTNYLSGITNYTDDSESGYVYGVPDGEQTLYDNYCIMIRPHYQKRNIIKVIPEVAEISAGAYIPYDDLTVRVPPVRPSIGSGSGNSLETGILQGNTVTISPNVTGSYIFDGWLYQVRGTDGEPTGQPFESTGGATVGVQALNRDGEEVTLRYSLDDDDILRIIMDDHFTIYARYTQMHNISVSATNISSSSFATALPKLNLSYKESVTATETVALIEEGVPTEELQALGFTFEDGVFNGTLKVGSILYASLSMNGVSTAFGAVDGFNPRYDRLSDVHVYVNNDDAFGTSDPELSNYDDSDVETIRALQTLQAYISGASLNDGNYAEYTGMLSDFRLEITANIAKRVRFDFISYGEINIGDFYETDSENSTAGIKLPLALSSAMGYDDVLWVYDGGEIDADGAVDGNIRLANVPLIGGNSYDGLGIPADMDFWLRIDNGTNIITLDNSDLPGMGISFGTGSGAAIGTKICNVSMYGTENSVFTELPFVYGDGSGSNPFMISTHTQLMNIDRVYKGTGFMNNVTFKLANDIVILPSAEVPFYGRLAADTDTVDENRLDMGFTGTFIGDGYGIYNFAVISEEDYTGLFSKIGSGGRVEDLYLSGQIQSESASYVGMLAGYVEGADIENVKIVSSYGGNTYENMVVGDIYVGGLVGYITGTSDADTASIAFDTAGNSRDYVIDGMIVIANTGGEYDNSSKEYRGGAGGIAGAVGPFASVYGAVWSDSADQQDFGSIQPLSALRDVVVSAESAYGSLIGSIEAGATAITDEMMQMAVYGFVIEYSSGGDSTQEGIAAVGGAVGFVGANSVLGFVNVEIPSGESQLGGAQAAQNVYSPTLNVVHSWGSGGIVGKNAGLIQYCNVTGDGLLSGEAAAMGGIVGVNFGKITNCTFSARLKSNRGAIGGSVGTTSSLGGIAGINWSGASIENSGVSGNKGAADYITEPTLEMITTNEVYNVEANGGMGNGLYAVYTNDDMTNIYVGLAVGYNGSNSFVNGGTFTGKIMVNRRSSDISTGATYIGGAIGYNDSNTASSVTTDVNIFFFHYMYVDSSIPVDENTTTEYLVQHLYVGGIYGGNGGTSTPGGSLTATIAAEYLGGGAAVSQDDLDQSSWSPSNAFMTGTNIGQAQVHNSGGTLRTGCQMPADPSGSILRDWYDGEVAAPEWVLAEVTTVNVNWTTWWKGYMYGGNGRYVQISV